MVTLRLVGTFLFLLLFAPLAVFAEVRPNIILMMTDDMGWGDPGYNGNTIIKTPHLDAMSRSGIRFDRFYAAAPVCSPTRGSCITGRNAYRFGIHNANDGHLRAAEITLAEMLKQNGYATGHFGKWHLGTLSPDYSGKGNRRNPKANFATPGMNGFEEWFSTEFAVATWDPYDPANSHLKSDVARDSRALYWHNGVNVSEPLVGDDSRIIVDRVIPFIEQSTAADKPFFAVVWFHAPHGPVVGGPGYRAMYPEHDEDAQHYYACITALDEQVGRIRRRLQEFGVEGNTMLWFCSDNGPEGNPGPVDRHRGTAGPFRGRKRSLYEGGIRVPGLLVWPDKISAARTVDTPCVTSDYLPTILDAAGMEFASDRPLDGVSLLPIIEGRQTNRSQAIGFELRGQSALLDDRYKLVHNSDESRPRSDNGQTPYEEWELYDLLSDPSETKNIASEQPAIVSKMKMLLEDWQASCHRSADGNDYH